MLFDVPFPFIYCWGRDDNKDAGNTIILNKKASTFKGGGRVQLTEHVINQLINHKKCLFHYYLYK